MNQHSDTDDTGKENGISTTTYAKVQAGYGYTTGSYNIGGTASDESTSTASFKVNANLTLGSGGTWNLSSGSEWSRSKMTDTEAYKGQGSLSLANSALPAVYSSNVHESGSSTTVDTDVNAWTVVNGGWSQTTQYVGSDDTSENYFDFTAKNTFSDPSLAPPDKGGIYTMHISSDTSSEQITASDFGYYLSTTTNWGQGEDSYNNVSSGVSMSDSWSMSKGGQNHVTGSWAGQDPPSYDTTVSYPGFGHAPGWDMSYYAAYTQNSGNPTGLVTPGFKTPGATNTVTPPYNVPAEVPPSANVPAGLRNQVSANAAAGNRPADNGGNSTYGYYLTHPFKMDWDLAAGEVGSWVVGEAAAATAAVITAIPVATVAAVASYGTTLVAGGTAAAVVAETPEGQAIIDEA